MSQRIIGITGTLGAGKGTVVEILVARYAFAHYSVRAYLTEEIIKRNLPVNRDSMVALGNDIRAEHGPGYIMQELYRRAAAARQDAVIESVRTTGEVAFLRSVNSFSLLAIDADPRLRYERIKARASKTDLVSFEQFISDEQRESTSLDDDKQNLLACIALADALIVNNASIPDLEKRVAEMMEQLSL